MIEVKDVTKRFADKVAVDALSFTVKPGEIMGLIGQNGAGKTTTFRMLLDFIEPNQGNITWNGQVLNNNLRQKIGFLPEERGLYQKLSIEEQVLYFAELHGMNRRDARHDLALWMDKFNVVGRPTDKVQKLSKGNAQKVQLIATLIFHPEFLILDEPFTGMDPVNADIILNEIHELKRSGVTIIFSSHNMSGVETLSDHVTMLRHGQTVLQGETNQIREQYGRTEIYLEAPQTDAELLAIPGVRKVEPELMGRRVFLTDPDVGRQVFALVSANGYVQAFSQQAPSLDQIFKQEVAKGEN